MVSGPTCSSSHLGLTKHRSREYSSTLLAMFSPPGLSELVFWPLELAGAQWNRRPSRRHVWVRQQGSDSEGHEKRRYTLGALEKDEYED